ncbi:MAG TPA: 50S ribosomal protein L25 [Candidatus Dormibacteraeota bacterium]
MKLTAQPRDLLGKKSHRLLREGGLPAVVYGHQTKALPITLDAREFAHVFHRVGRTHLIDLEIDGRADKVLVKEVQTHPRRHGPIHVDLHQVSLSEKLQVDVPVIVTGESPVVKQGEADVQINVHTVRVECLPTDIPESFTVDISGLAAVGDVLRVSDLAPVPNVTVIDDPEEVVVKIAPRRELVVEEEEVAPAEGEAEEGAAAEEAEGEAQAAAEGGEAES